MKLSAATSLAWLIATVALFAGSGASCQRPLTFSPFAAQGPPAPQVLPEAATREQIIAAVNQNSSRVQSITATSASISIPDTMNLPLLTANIAAERPNRVRITAGTALTGQELDLGSNDQLFWMWVRRNQPPAVYFCRHEQFANSAIRQMMPVEPAWLLSATGMTELNPANVIDGPLPRSDGTVELRMFMPSASGNLQRVVVIDARRAWVVEQHVYDPTGRTLLASAVAETHTYYPAEQVSLPQKISLRLPTAGLALKIDMGAVQINRLSGDPTQLWAMPVFEGYQKVDLGGALPNTPLPGQPSPAQSIPMQSIPNQPLPMQPPAPPTAQFTYPHGQVEPASYQPPASAYSPYIRSEFVR
ncbi:MAG: hypothetical protein AB7G28_05175 [Pirellulales bacterium]